MFQSSLAAIRCSTDTKLTLYSILKREYTYENYANLQNVCNVCSLIKFKLSIHALPIETGRYKRTKIERKNRLCIFCNNNIGSEFHVLFECQHNTSKNMRTLYLNKIENISPQIKRLSITYKFIYILKGHDLSIVPLVCQWIDRCNEAHTSKQ